MSDFAAGFGLGGRAALTRTYVYDPIGNRTAATENTGNDAIETIYAANQLNQYERATASGPSTLGQGLSYDADGNLVERYVAGDMDNDGDIDFDDLDCFVEALSGPCSSTQNPSNYACEPESCLRGDMDGDGDVDFGVR